MLICENEIEKIPEENLESIIRNSLHKLGGFLFRHNGIHRVILIDNYDMPANIAMIEGFYHEILNIMQNFFRKHDENPYL